MSAADKNVVDELSNELMECICDKYCKYPFDKSLSQEALYENCTECKAVKIVQQILKEYNRVNEFEQSQCAKLLAKITKLEKEKNSGI